MDEKLMTLPVIALRGLTVLPEMIQHFDISRDKSISAVEHAMVGEQKVFLVTQRQIEEEDPDASGLFQIGTIARIKQLVKIPGGLVRVMVEGLERAELINLLQDDPYLEAEVAEAPLMEENLSDTVKEAMARIVKEKLEEFGNGNPKTVKDFMGGLMAITDLNELLIQTAGQFPWEYTVKQELLECGYVSHLYDRVVYYLMREIEILKIKRDYQGKVKASIDKNQRDYILREELKVIQEELGEEYTGSDADSFLEQLEKLNADKETKEKIRKEIMRFKAMPGGSQEANVLRTYIETVRASLEKDVPGQPGYPPCGKDPGGGPLRTGKGQGAGAGISGSPGPDQKGDQPHPLPGGPAGNGKDLHRPVGGQGIK